MDFWSVSRSSAKSHSFLLTARTISRSAVMKKEYPRLMRIFTRYSGRSRPAKSKPRINEGWREAMCNLVDGTECVAGVHHEGRRASCSEQRQYGLDRHEKGGHAKRHEHELRLARRGGEKEHPQPVRVTTQKRKKKLRQFTNVARCEAHRNKTSRITVHMAGK